MDKALENDIKIFMASRIAEGISLSDIQNEVNEKFQLSMTYMDIRILAAGLDIDWQAKAAAKAEEEGVLSAAKIKRLWARASKFNKDYNWKTNQVTKKK